MELQWWSSLTAPRSSAIVPWTSLELQGVPRETLKIEPILNFWKFTVLKGVNPNGSAAPETLVLAETIADIIATLFCGPSKKTDLDNVGEERLKLMEKFKMCSAQKSGSSLR